MGELVDRDHEHLRLLKIGYYIMAGLTGGILFFSLFYIAMGGLFASGVIPAQVNSNADPRLMGGIFLGVGVAIMAIGLIITFLCFFAARSLRDHRRRIFCVIVAGLSCLQIPWGTAI